MEMTCLHELLGGAVEQNNIKPAAFHRAHTLGCSHRVKHLMVSFSIPAWKQRLKPRKRAMPGQIVFIKEDKELAQLRGMAETVGLANACYAVRYVLTANVLLGQNHLRGLPWTSFHQGTHP